MINAGSTLNLKPFVFSWTNTRNMLPIHVAHIISNYSIHFENFLQTKIFENAIQSEMVLTHLRYDTTLHASHLDGYMAHIYIYCLVQFGALWFEFIPHSIQYFCSSLPIFKLPQIQQRALLFSVVIIVLNGNNTVLIQDPEHFMDTFSKQLQITKRWWIIWVQNASLKVCYVPANSQLEIYIFNIYGFLIGYLIAFTNRINTAQHIWT